MCIFLDRSEIYIDVIHMLDSFLRIKDPRNRFREPQVWGKVSEFALRNNSQNFHMVLKMIWLGFLSWWRGVKCFNCFIPRRGAWPIIGWVWNTIVLWKKHLNPTNVSLLDFIVDFYLRLFQICQDYQFGSKNVIG